MNTMIRALTGSFLTILIAACGGGGSTATDAGGTIAGGTTAVAESAPITLQPAALVANVAAGTSGTLVVRATVKHPDRYSAGLYVLVIDPKQVLTGVAELAQIDATTYSATVHTRGTLPLGRHAGSFDVMFCKDARCASPYPGFPLSLPYELTVAASPLQASPVAPTTVSATRGGTPPQPVAVKLSAEGLSWSAATDASWLRIDGATGRGSGSFSVRFETAGLAAGAYSTTVRVVASDGQAQTIVFAITVLPDAPLGPVPPSGTGGAGTGGTSEAGSISTYPDDFSLRMTNGSQPVSRGLTVQVYGGIDRPWSVTSSAPWVTVTPSSGNSTTNVTVQFDPSRGPVASGSHEARLSFTSPGRRTAIVPVTLDLRKPTLESTADTIVIGGPKGRAFATETVALTLPEAGQPWPLALSTSPSWLAVAPSSPTVGTSPTTVSFSPVLANAAIGSTTTTVQATSQINGDAVVRAFTATLNVDRRRVLVSEWGVALASTPSGQVLARTLSVTDNFTGSAPAGLSWTSDSAWLTASSAGANGAPAMLTLTASPAALTSDVLHQATLTVRSTTPGIQAAVVRVGLYKTSSGVTSAQLLPQGYSHIVADRIGPYVYAHDGSTSIDIYDAQAARKVSTLSGVGVSLGQMAVSPDGSRLFALDTASRLLRVVDLRTSVVQSWPLDSAVDASVSIAALRPNGVDVVMLGDGTAYSEGRSLGVTDLRGALATNPDGRRVVAHGVSYGWTYTTVADVDYSEIGGGTLMLGNVAGTSSSEGAVEVDVAIDPSGSRLYTSTAGGGRCSVTSLTDLSFVGFLPGSPSYQSNVEILRDGRLVCSVITYEGAHRIRIYGPDGVLLADKADPSPGVLQGKLRTTSDGLLIVAPAVGARLLIMPSAP